MSARRRTRRTSRRTSASRWRRKLAHFGGRSRFSTWLVSDRDQPLPRCSAAAAIVGRRWRRNTWRCAKRRTPTRRTPTGRRAWLHEALQSLEPSLRETVLLVVGEDLSHRGGGRDPRLRGKHGVVAHAHGEEAIERRRTKTMDELERLKGALNEERAAPRQAAREAARRLPRSPPSMRSAVHAPPRIGPRSTVSGMRPMPRCEILTGKRHMRMSPCTRRRRQPCRAHACRDDGGEPSDHRELPMARRARTDRRAAGRRDLNAETPQAFGRVDTTATAEQKIEADADASRHRRSPPPTSRAEPSATGVARRLQPSPRCAGAVAARRCRRSRRARRKHAAPDSRDAVAGAAQMVARRCEDADAAGAITTRAATASRRSTPTRVKVTAEEPVSTFSIDVDTSSYSFMRASLQQRRAAAGRFRARRGADQLLPLRLSGAGFGRAAVQGVGDGHADAVERRHEARPASASRATTSRRPRGRAPTSCS